MIKDWSAEAIRQRGKEQLAKDLQERSNELLQELNRILSHSSPGQVPTGAFVDIGGDNRQTITREWWNRNKQEQADIVRQYAMQYLDFQTRQRAHDARMAAEQEPQ